MPKLSKKAIFNKAYETVDEYAAIDARIVNRFIYWYTGHSSFSAITKTIHIKWDTPF